MISTLKQRFEGQKPALHLMEEFLRGRRFVDLGCGNGLPLKYLAERNPDKLWVGLDHSLDILNKSEVANLEQVLLVRGLLTEPEFPEAQFDTVIFNKSLHEVFSLSGEQGLRAALKNGAAYLKPGGYMLIYENVIEDRSEVSLEFLDEESATLFSRFVADYSIRKIRYRNGGEAKVRLCKDDAMEFLTKFKEPNWDCEMKEAHFIFTQREWHEALQDVGLRREEVRSFSDRQILVTEGIRVGWDIQDFKYLFIYRRPF